MGSMLPYISYMDPMGIYPKNWMFFPSKPHLYIGLSRIAPSFKNPKRNHHGTKVSVKKNPQSALYTNLGVITKGAERSEDGDVPG